MKYFGIIKVLLALSLAGGVCLQAEEPYKIDFIKQFGTTGYEYIHGSSTIDSRGNIFVTGSTNGVFDGEVNHGGFDAFVTKYSDNGTLLWSKEFGTSKGDIAYDITTDNNDNIFVTGYTTDNRFGTPQVFVTKYSNDGVFQWTEYFSMYGSTFGRSIATDMNGNVFVTGYKRYYQDTAFILKYNSSGVHQWTKMVSVSGARNSSIATSVTTDKNGNAYMTGSTAGVLDGEIDTTGNPDAFIIKYNTYGEVVWNRQFASTNGTNGQGITIDSLGNIFVSGYTYGTFAGERSYGHSDIFVTKHDANGTLVWNKQVGTYYGEYVYSNSITTDPDDNVLISGVTGGAFNGESNYGGNDALVVKYSTSGSLMWAKHFGTDGEDIGNSVVSNSRGDIFVAGSTKGTFDGEVNLGDGDLFFAKLSSPNTAPVSIATATPQEVILNGTTVELDASQSYDIDADNITYAWGWIAQPAGSAAALSDASSINPTFIPDVKGDYSLYLDVTDTSDVTTRSEITVTFTNIEPVAISSAVATAVVGDTVTLDGSLSSDANGDALTYNWSLVSQPALSTAFLKDTMSSAPYFMADAEGSYEVSLSVNDGMVESETVNTTIEVISVQTAITILIEQAIADINAMPDSSFKNANNKKTLVKKLEVVLKMVEDSNYGSAADKLANDVITKVDDEVKSNWIISGEASSVYELLNKALLYLK